MNSFSAVIVFFLLVPFSYGQLTVKPTSSHKDSYLYVDGALLFVNQNVNLQKNADGSPTEASIYLRKEGQLIQGKEDSSINTGNGLISVFQEGTSNAFDYNYWSSPVSNGVYGNGDFGIGLLYFPIGPTTSMPANITNSFDGIASPLSISDRWIYTFSGTSYSDWKAIFSEISIPAGIGFSMKGVNGTDLTTVDGRANNPGNSQRYDFRGKPNNGPIAIPVEAEEQILIGNPFPSALDLSLFLLENSGTGSFNSTCYGTISRKPATTGIAYFWDSVENGNSHYLADYVGGYGAFSPVDPCTSGIYEKPIFRSYGPSASDPTGFTGNHYNRRYLPIGQGFMVKSISSSVIDFKNHQRIFKKEGENSDFKASALTRKTGALITIPKLRLEAVINDHYKRSFTLAFWPTATFETDMGMDAESFDLAPTDIGWLHQGSNYVIDVRPFSEMDQIPLYLKVDEPQAKIRIVISALEGLELEDLFIFDSLYGLYYPISENSFQVVLQEGEYHDRFKVCFVDRSRIPPAESSTLKDFKVIQNNNKRRLEIYNPGSKDIEAFFLYDLLGKELITVKEPEDVFFSIPTPNFANSIYIVKVLFKDHRELIQKININNNSY